MNFFSSFKIHCLQMLQLFQTEDGPFFSSSHLSTLVALFLLYHQKYLSHILFWSQFVSVCFGLKLFCSFKIHCLQMLQLFQTRDGPFFFFVTLVYTCRAFFAVSSKNIYPIYCFGHSSSQSVSQWNSFPPLKYIVYKCYSSFRPGMGHFFHCHTCLHLSRFFCCIIKNIYPIYCFGHSSSQSVSEWNSFPPLKYIVYKC